MKRIAVTDDTYRTLKSMAETDGVSVAAILTRMTGYELERRRRYDAREAVKDLNRTSMPETGPELLCGECGARLYLGRCPHCAPDLAQDLNRELLRP